MAVPFITPAHWKTCLIDSLQCLTFETVIHSMWTRGWPLASIAMQLVCGSMQPGQDFEVVPGTQFTVSRTAQRNNKSDYYINDRRSNFTEVTDMLKGKGIDLDNNRFLILQVTAGMQLCSQQAIHIELSHHMSRRILSMLPRPRMPRCLCSLAPGSCRCFPCILCMLHLGVHLQSCHNRQIMLCTLPCSAGSDMEGYSRD